jgi:hypothetical protein
MKMRFVLFALLASGCQTTQLPTVAVNQTTADDRAIMPAVLDGALRAERDRGVRLGQVHDDRLRGAAPSDSRAPTGALFLVLDSTVPSGSPEARAAGNPLLGCFDVGRCLCNRCSKGLALDRDDQSTSTMLAQRNPRSLAIRGKLGEAHTRRKAAVGCSRCRAVRCKYSAELKDCRFALPVESNDVFAMAPQ